MNLVDRLRVVGIAFAIFLVSVPVAIILTIASIPFWSWVESRFAIESVGHSGPAGWCYLASYISILSGAVLIWRVIRRRSNAPNVA